MSSNGPSGGFSLFPSPSVSKTPPRRTTPRPRAATPQSPRGRGPSIDMSPPRNGRRTPEDLTDYVIDGTPSMDNELRIAPNNPFYQSQAGPSAYKPASPPPDVPPKDVPPRTATALSGAATIVRNPSERSRKLLPHPGKSNTYTEDGHKQAIPRAATDRTKESASPQSRTESDERGIRPALAEAAARPARDPAREHDRGAPGLLEGGERMESF
ncbi:hypothetical protein CHU98_g8020 [Xylaria longipes]|nr:hypothetical protein CHU98_g8020 [Xylaria longipes]